MRRLILALIATSLMVPAFAAAPAYQLAHKFVLGGDGGWDYITYDPAGKRLFISRSTRVMVVDPKSGALLGEIPNTPGVHGIALAPELKRGFTSNGQENSVTVFDLDTLKEVQRIKIPGPSQGPDAIVYEPVSQRIFTFNGHSSDSTVIDAKTGAVVATLPLPGRPEAAGVDGKGLVYLNIEDKSEASAIDGKSAKVLRTWSLAPCDSPSGIAVDGGHERVFSGCDNKVVAISDGTAGKVLATLPIGDGVDAGGFDPATGLAFSSNGEGTLTVVHEDSPDKFSVLQDATTQKYARTMAVDPDSHDVYLVTGDVQITPPPAGAPAGTRPKRTVLPGTFSLLVMHRP